MLSFQNHNDPDGIIVNWIILMMQLFFWLINEHLEIQLSINVFQQLKHNQVPSLHMGEIKLLNYRVISFFLHNLDS